MGSFTAQYSLNILLGGIAINHYGPEMGGMDPICIPFVAIPSYQYAGGLLEKVYILVMGSFTAQYSLNILLGGIAINHYGPEMGGMDPICCHP